MTFFTKPSLSINEHINQWSSRRLVIPDLTFKKVSVLFSQLRLKKDKQSIASFWNLPDTVLKSWFRALSDLRNICAHHARTWNREFGSKPVLPRKTPSPWPDFSRLLADSRIDPTRRLYFFLVVIKILLQRINPGSTWHKRLFELLQSHPNVSRAHMEMPGDWANDPFRRLS